MIGDRMIDAYKKNIEEIYKELKTSKNGLSKAEAKRRLEKYGENVIQGKKRRSKLQIFLSQFKNFMVILLLVVGVLSFFYALFETHDYLDSIVILGTTFVNILMGYLQEDKAEDAVEKLKIFSTFDKVDLKEADVISMDLNNFKESSLFTPIFRLFKHKRFIEIHKSCNFFD